MEVYVSLAAGILAGYIAARLLVRWDPSGRGARTERLGVVTFAALTVLVVLVVAIETHVQDATVRAILRGGLIFATAGAFTAAVSSFLIYAKRDATRDKRLN